MKDQLGLFTLAHPLADTSKTSTDGTQNKKIA